MGREGGVLEVRTEDVEGELGERWGEVGREGKSRNGGELVEMRRNDVEGEVGGGRSEGGSKRRVIRGLGNVGEI